MGSLPALKARPEWTGPVLEMIDDRRGSYRDAEAAIVEWWHAQSARSRPPSTRNSLRAVFGPTLRHLHLVRGEGGRIQLTSLGVKLLEDQRRGEANYKKSLAQILVRLDATEWISLLPRLLESPEGMEIDEVAEYARATAPGAVDRQKVTKYVRFFIYAGVLAQAAGRLTIRPAQYEAARTGAWQPLPDRETFLSTLKLVYDRISARRVFVPIPEVRDAVCGDLGIWDDEFDDMLRTIPKETPRSVIQLTAPMKREVGGLRIGQVYVYYIAVHEKVLS